MKNKVDGINLKHGEREDVECWADGAFDVSIERDDRDDEKERRDQAEEWGRDPSSPGGEWKDEKEVRGKGSFHQTDQFFREVLHRPYQLVEEPKDKIHT